jgi:signal transduction histidine kinase/DNA-binding LacI/PurR family transcriptional regulator
MVNDILDKNSINFNKSRPTIGAFLDILSNSYHLRYWKGLIEGAIANDVNLLCFPDVYSPSLGEHDIQRIRAMLDLANNKRIDGIINWSSTLAWTVTRNKFPDFFKKLQENVNFIKFQHIPDDIPITIMGSYQGTKDIIDHFVKVHGFRRIVMIKGPEHHLGSMERFRAYKDALTEHDIHFDPNIVSFSSRSFLVKSGEEAMDNLLKRGIPHFDAVFAASDSLAYGALASLKKHGIRVPQDIALIGFDDDPIASTNIPTLTTINPRFEDVGKHSVDMLVSILMGKNVPYRQYVPPELIIRQSCGCFDPALEKATKKITDIPILPPNRILKDQYFEFRNKLITEINFNFKNPLFHHKLDELVMALIEELEQNKEKAFIYKLNDIMDFTIEAYENPGKWHSVISVLRFYSLAYISEEKIKINAENIFQQARIMIGQTDLLLSEKKRNLETNLDSKLNEIEKELIITFDIKKLMEKLKEKLPELKIPSCYLSLYESKKFPFTWSKLILAYKNYKELKLPEDGIRFKSNALIPDAFFTDERSYSFITEPLYFQKIQLGFIVFEIENHEGVMYERLRNQISSAIQGALLVKEKDKRMEELNKAYNYLKENQEQLLISEKMASLGRLTAGIAHEMNTPLATVRTAMKQLGLLIEEYSNSIGNPKVLPEDFKEIADEMLKYQKMANAAAEKNAIFIRGIKAQTYTTNDNYLNNFDAAYIINDTLDLLEFALKKGCCNLTKGIETDISLFGDPRWLSQIITNLVINSIDACKPDGGTIKIRLKKNDKGTIKLEVEDSGCGITKENKKHIFDPLFTTKPFGEGTGLGLSIVHEMVIKFKGSIKVDSTPGCTNFIITFPVTSKTEGNHGSY